jgi:uncharacterized metal-binding protein YceD (DUF177 family)
MKIHLRQIPLEGLHLEGEEKCPLAEFETEDLRCAGPLRYNLDVGISEGALWANGSLIQPVELRCVACLENFTHDITVPAFALHTELHGPETVDLAPAMREDLLLNLPAHPHCDRDGDRICSGAMPALATEAEKQEEEAKREHDWQALDRLKIKQG